MATLEVVSEQDWQVPCTEVKQRGAHLLRTGLWSDCKFLVGPERVEFSVHRLILAMASPVFEAMFYGSIAETKNSIPIPDVSPKTFRSLLQYMYTDEIIINSFSEAYEVLCAAHRYMLPHVVKVCTVYMSSNMIPEDACRCYELACLYSETELMHDALTVMSNRTKQVLTSKSFEEADLSTIVKLFSLSALDVDSELDLLIAAEKYARVHGNTDQDRSDGLTIRSALQQIRFLTLSSKKLLEHESDLLTDLDRSAIIKNISSKHARVSMPVGFSTCREGRNREWLQEHLGVASRITVVGDTVVSFQNISKADRLWAVHVGKSKSSILQVHLTALNPNLGDYSWSRMTIAEVTVVSHKDSENIVGVSKATEFNRLKNYLCLYEIPLQGTGFIKDNSVIVEMRVYFFESKEEAVAAEVRLSKR